MSLLFFLLFGLVVGLLARAIMPGEQKMGWISTMLLGVVGSFVGGFLAALVTDRRVTDLNTSGMIGSVLGALLVMVIAGAISSRRRRSYV
jgi:uncharacterized membrane protein YeaQ/YmgE (transglycosylase-associated protein family)